MDVFDQNEKRNWRWTIITAAAVIFALVFFAILRPAYIGYTVYQEIADSNVSVETYGLDRADLESQLLVESAKRGSAENVTAILLGDQKELQDALVSCRVDLATAQKDFSRAQEELAQTIAAQESDRAAALRDLANGSARAREDLQRSCDLVAEDFQELQEAYNLLLSETVRSICCKQKLDDSSLNYYEIIKGKLYCLSQGSTRFSCPFS